MSRQAPTLVEVARAAGVSTATAARALGNYGRVKDSTREAVKLAAERLNYRPNELARSMITGRTRSIGVICGDVHIPFFAGVVRGITDVARGRGYTVLITNSDEDWETEVESLGILESSRVDGIIISPSDPNRVDHLRHWGEGGRPLVMVDRASARFETDAVVIDGPTAIEAAVIRLFDLGHERVAIVGEFSPDSEVDRLFEALGSEVDGVGAFDFSPSITRLIGYVRAHRTRGIPLDESLIVRSGAYSIDAAERATTALLAGDAAPTAIVTTDNSMSLGAYRAVRSAGLRVPEELSFIGFDNQDWTEFAAPGISVIDQPSYAMGQAAARMLLDRVDGMDAPARILTEPATFIERGSVAPRG
ncbi:LacI family DNA-binding transcriptional regulator [Zhihengliuella sp. ISTPL4]|uniref:LacI family DNA-binding transcriptional regulator n=1 Tax=Zhihengliuella sp. ISTPL4 TaxID=2058657 RepID=UPI0013053764|nr:LacI family DNA-binding transcriptional regulator [Zhihengliuella sp. ISTPL4]